MTAGLPVTSPAQASAIPALGGGAPLLGNLLEFRRDPAALLRRVAAECGDVGRFRLGRLDVIIVSSPALARTVLVDEADAFEKGPTIRKYARPVLGDGLIACANADHKPRRRLMLPAFHSQHIARYADVMAQVAARTQAGWADGAVVDVADEMTRLTLSVVGRTLFSVDLLTEAPELAEAMATMIRHVSDRIRWPWRRLPKRALARLDATILRMIAERRARGAAAQPDLLDSLVDAKAEDGAPGLSDRQIRDEAMNLFAAGHETTANALAWALHLLAAHPAVAARLRAEVDGVVGARAPRYEDVGALPYTLQVIKETMRLYPPVHSLGRQAVRAVRLGDHALAAGAIVVVSPYLMHRRADLFADPERFDPDRFTPAAEEALPRHAYLPFAAGPRLCLGSHFALTEAQLVLAVLAQHVALAPAAAGRPVVAEMLVTLRPRDGLPMRVTRRHGQGHGHGDGQGHG